jgi:hypothetical protein
MAKKIGRNDKCPCGSGLKYKTCCLDKEITHYADMKKSENNTDEKTIISILKGNSKKITNEDGNGFYRIFWDDNVEKVNPIEYYKQYELQKRAISYRDILEIKDPILTAKLSDDSFIRFAKEKLNEEKFWEIKEETEVPENFLKLFETTRKKDQESLLKGLSINPNQLIALIFKSYKDYGYLYSRYRFENLPKGLENKEKPEVADISEDGIIKTIGKTDLTKGQVKNMIEQRKVIIAHFFDKGDDWHCLFTTYNSIEGKENWKDGQPHFHYISSAFGITRDKFIESMNSGQYKSTSIHIDLLEYGNQTI